jgi:hypothetical protein
MIDTFESYNDVCAMPFFFHLYKHVPDLLMEVVLAIVGAR